MRTLLVITRQPMFASAIESALDPSRYRVIPKEDAVSAGALLTRRAMDAVILDLEVHDALAIRSIEDVRALAPDTPMLVFASTGFQSWEEQAYLLGVEHVLEKPVRARLLQNLLDRSFRENLDPPPAALVLPPPPPVLQYLPPSRPLEPLRRFSSLLVHSLDARQLLRDALQQLREALGINRAAVFLRRPSALNTDGIPSTDDHWLRPAHTIGHEPGLIHEFPLSLANGIGNYLYKHARILRADHPEARANREIAKEFATLGSAIALPIHDREMLLGVLVIDERITGGGFSDDELAQLFHWLEELGVALRNCWRHEQLAATHGLIDDVLGGLGSGCIVIGANCGVLHANPAAMKLLVPDRPTATRIDFAEIPQAI